MSNELSPFDNVQLPAHLAGAQSAASDLVVSEGGLPRVTAKDGHFVIKKDGEEKHLPLGQPVSVIILAATPKGKACAKVFYEGAWNPDSHDGPDCSSANGVAPDAGVPKPQAQSCATCPQNAWGSGTDQNGVATKGKACSDRKELILVQSHKINDDIFMMSVPPTSLKALSVFGRELAKHSIPMDGVSVSIGFNVESPKELTFKFEAFLDVGNYAIAAARAASGDVLEHVVDPAAIAGATQSVAAPVSEPEVTATQSVAAPVSEPVVEVEEDDDDDAMPVDSAGVAWDPTVHAANQSKKADGTWKASRSKKAEPVKASVEATAGPVVQEPAGATQNLDAILADW